VISALSTDGITEPFAIQRVVIGDAIAGRDVIAKSPTGSGKTLAFGIPLVERIAAEDHRPAALVLAPTRELATQIVDDIRGIAHARALRVTAVYGGVGLEKQAREAAKSQVLVATPGRLEDLLARGAFTLARIRIVVLDEADRMLDMGFIPDVERIVGLLPETRQTLFFSATMPAEIRKLADAFLRDPIEVSVAPPASPAATVAQSIAVVGPGDKREALRRLIRSEDVKNALIFCNRKRDVDILFRSLARHGFDAAALHGDMPQPKRTETLDRFRNGEIRLLVASDVAARGLDIKGMSHVFCFDVPIHAEDYVHRIGRTGRAGLEGRSFMLASPEDGDAVAAIVKLIGKEIPPIAIEGIEAAELEYGERRSRRGARRPVKSDRRRTRTDAAPRREPAESRAPRRERRPSAKEAAQQDLPASNVTSFPRAPLARVPRRPERQPEPDRQVVGFGDHLPAFLARPPRIVARP
jgi:superfamily II DNA/RNA helicase